MAALESVHNGWLESSGHDCLEARPPCLSQQPHKPGPSRRAQLKPWSTTCTRFSDEKTESQERLGRRFTLPGVSQGSLRKDTPRLPPPLPAEDAPILTLPGPQSHMQADPEWWPCWPAGLTLAGILESGDRKSLACQVLVCRSLGGDGPSLAAVDLPP